MKQLTLDALLTSGAERNLRDANPWWRGERQYDVATIKRWAYAPVLKGLLKGLAPVTVLRGPRQVGKTTLLNQVTDELLNQGVDPRRIFRVQFDDIPDLRKLGTPILDLADQPLALERDIRDARRAIDSAVYALQRPGVAQGEGVLARVAKLR